MLPDALSHIKAISPYLPGKPITELAREMQLPEYSIIKLASNENPWGMSPLAQQAVSGALAGICRYPDQFDLVRKIAAFHNVDPQQVVIGNGSNDILDIVARVFLNEQTAAVYAQYAFAIYALATQTTGARGYEIAAADYGHDLPAMLNFINNNPQHNIKLVWIANPNNPTGTFIRQQTMLDFLDQLPKDIVVVLDEAYNEYLNADELSNSIHYLPQYANLVVTRTMSKIYGLAGLRVGYAITSASIADWMNRIRQPFNVNNLALAAAHAALDDVEFLSFSYTQNQQQKTILTTALNQLGCHLLPGYGNFVTMRMPENCTLSALAVHEALQRHGIIVRPLAAYNMADWLRVTVGKPNENESFISILREILTSQ